MTTKIPITNRLFFLNTGVIAPDNAFRRRWIANRTYGFVSAGHNEESGEAIQRLINNDIFCAYISKYGFVAIGQIEGEITPIGESFLNTVNRIHDWPLLNHNPITGLFDKMGNLELQEYIARVRWLKYPVNGISNAIINPNRQETIRYCSTKGLGFKIYPGVCCILDRTASHQLEQIRFIENSFDITFDFYF